ncbi:MAG: NADH-quinone oxidoreductase subunit N [Sulfolobales archaeon]|jgi:NADH-quinone oxidoreductase subunit N
MIMDSSYIIYLLYNLYIPLLISLLIGGFVALAVSKVFNIGLAFPRNMSRAIILFLLIYLIVLIILYPGYPVPVSGLFPYFSGIDEIVLLISLTILLSSFIVISSYPLDSIDTISVLAVSLLGVLGSALISMYGITYVMDSLISIIPIIVSWALLSIASYAVIALFKDPLSLDASSRYAIVGVIASQFLLFGLSFFVLFNFVIYSRGVVYGFIGQDVYRLFLVLWVSMLLVALGFKLGSAPFHFWLPDVYGRGSPYAVAAVAGFIKIGLVGLLLRFARYVFDLGSVSSYAKLDIDSSSVFFYIAALLAVLSMLIGSITPLTQVSIQRILAFSSIAHIGFVFVGVAVLSIAPIRSSAYFFALAGVLLHVLAYSISKSSLFILTGFMRGVYGSSNLSVITEIPGKPNALKTSIIIHLANLIGVPPLPGFWGKLFLFLSATYGDPRLYIGSVPWLALLGVLASVFSVFYYLNIMRAVSIEIREIKSSSSNMSQRPDLFYPYIASFLVIVLGLLAPIMIIYLRLI